MSLDAILIFASGQCPPSYQPAASYPVEFKNLQNSSVNIVTYTFWFFYFEMYFLNAELCQSLEQFDHTRLLTGFFRKTYFLGALGFHLNTSFLSSSTN